MQYGIFGSFGFVCGTVVVSWAGWLEGGEAGVGGEFGLGAGGAGVGV